MAWLTENWLFVLLIMVALLFLLRRGGMGCAVGGHGGGSGHGRDAPESPPIDPVSREPVARDSTISSVYRGKVYRFASRQNRDSFEAAPDRFATSAAAEEGGKHRHGGHGCC